MEDFVDLFTRQHENSIFELIQKGEITNKELYVRLHTGPDAQYFMDRYRTFVEMAEKRVPRPEGTEYPIWGSVTDKFCMKPEYNSICYCLKVPKEEIIYFDGMKWDYVLNYLYIPKDDQDAKAHQKELQALGIQSGHFLFTDRYNCLYPEMKEKIKASWERIFEIEDWGTFNVQGNIWRIKPEWVVRVLHPGDNLFGPPERPLDLARDAAMIKDRQTKRGSQN